MAYIGLRDSKASLTAPEFATGPNNILRYTGRPLMTFGDVKPGNTRRLAEIDDTDGVAMSYRRLMLSQGTQSLLEQRRSRRTLGWYAGQCCRLFQHAQSDGIATQKQRAAGNECHAWFEPLSVLASKYRIVAMRRALQISTKPHEHGARSRCQIETIGGTETVGA